MTKTKAKHLFAAVSCALLAACLVALPAEGGSGRGTLYSVTSLGGSPATYRLAVNSTSGVTVGDHVMAKVSGGGSGVWEVTAKTSSTVTVEDSLTEQNGSEFGAPVAGGADSVWAYSTPTATGLTIIPDGAQHWAAALRRNTYLQSTSAASHALLSSTHSDTLASTVSRGSVIVGNSTPAYAEVAPTVTGTILRFDGTDTTFSVVDLDTVMESGATGSVSGNVSIASTGGNITLSASSGAVVLGSTPTIYGASDTNSVRLRLSGGVLEVREGDDSAYAPFRASAMVVDTSFNYLGTAYVSGMKLLTTANTSDSAIAASSTGRIHTNEGASGAVNLTLPSATGASGYFIEAVVQANQYLRFTAATGDTIRDGSTVSASAGYIRSTTVGSAIRLYCINATEWVVLSKTGTWTVDS